LRIVSQNVAKRLPKSGHAIVRNLLNYEADVVALQEITIGQVDGWCSLLSSAGYGNVVRASGYSRAGGVLLASRAPISPAQLHSSDSAGQRVAAGLVGEIGVASVYFPAGNGAVTWSAFYDDLVLNPAVRDFILIGDYQMVVEEIEISSGTFRRWKSDPSFTLMQGMLRHWRDAFRTVHGSHHVAYSHRHNSGALWLNDHAFVPPSIEILGCEIDWSPVDEGLSDHGALLLEIKSVK
jgi:exonuclease III